MMLSETVKAERYDSSYAAFPQRNYLNKILSNNEYRPLKEILTYISSGHTPYLHDVKNEGDVNFATVECISDLSLHADKFKRITKDQYESQFRKNRFKIGYVVCTIKRRICKAFPITKDYGSIAINQDISIMCPNKDVNAVYLATYLSSKVGQLFANRQMTEQMNPYISVGNLSQLPIILLNKKFQDKIESIFIKSLDHKDNSIKLYAQAENLLLETLGLTDFNASTDPTNIKSFKNSFEMTGRLDAEYYQKKYDDYLKHVFSLDNGWAPLNEVCIIKDKTNVPNDTSVFKYIELANIDNYGDVSGYTTDEGRNLPSRARIRVNHNDVLVSSIEGSLSKCAIISENMNNAICSTGFYVLKSININPATLLVLFKSPLMQNLLKQNCSGTILTAINKDEFSRIPVPLICKKEQLKIEKLIQDSFSLREKSKHLLKVAKKAVEIAIEKSEKKAMKYISNEMEPKK